MSASVLSPSSNKAFDASAGFLVFDICSHFYPATRKIYTLSNLIFFLGSSRHRRKVNLF